MLGQTHHPLLRGTAADGLLLNPGSVGQPRDGDPMPSWALLDLASGRAELAAPPTTTARLSQSARTRLGRWCRGGPRPTQVGTRAGRCFSNEGQDSPRPEEWLVRRRARGDRRRLRPLPPAGRRREPAGEQFGGRAGSDRGVRRALPARGELVERDRDPGCRAQSIGYASARPTAGPGGELRCSSRPVHPLQREAADADAAGDRHPAAGARSWRPHRRRSRLAHSLGAVPPSGWRHLEGPVAALNRSIDGSPGGLPGGTSSLRFTGLHRIEFGLWTGASPQSLVPYAKALAANVRALKASAAHTISHRWTSPPARTRSWRTRSGICSAATTCPESEGGLGTQSRVSSPPASCSPPCGHCSGNQRALQADPPANPRSEAVADAELDDFTERADLVGRRPQRQLRRTGSPARIRPSDSTATSDRRSRASPRFRECSETETRPQPRGSRAPGSGSTNEQDPTPNLPEAHYPRARCRRIGGLAAAEDSSGTRPRSTPPGRSASSMETADALTYRATQAQADSSCRLARCIRRESSPSARAGHVRRADSLAADRATLALALQSLSQRARALAVGGPSPCSRSTRLRLTPGSLGPSDPPDDLTVTIAFGASLFDGRYGLPALPTRAHARCRRFRSTTSSPAQSLGDVSSRSVQTSVDTRSCTRSANCFERPRDSPGPAG